MSIRKHSLTYTALLAAGVVIGVATSRYVDQATASTDITPAIEVQSAISEQSANSHQPGGATPPGRIITTLATESTPTLEQMRAMVREELHSQLESLALSSPQEEAPSYTAEQLHQQQEKVVEVDLLLDQAIDQGNWDQASAMNFELALSQLPTDLQFEAMKRRARAVNRGEIAPYNLFQTQ